MLPSIGKIYFHSWKVIMVGGDLILIRHWDACRLGRSNLWEVLSSGFSLHWECNILRILPTILSLWACKLLEYMRGFLVSQLQLGNQHILWREELDYVSFTAPRYISPQVLVALAVLSWLETDLFLYFVQLLWLFSAGRLVFNCH